MEWDVGNQMKWDNFKGFLCEHQIVYYVEPGKPRKKLGPVFDYSKWKKKDLKWFDEAAYNKMYGKDK